MQYNVTHLTKSVSRAAGGLFESVRHLSQAVAAAGNKFQVNVIGTYDSYTDQDIKVWQPIAVRTHAIWGHKRFGYARGMTADLFASEPHLVHVHGMWQYPSIVVLRWARRTSKPYIVSTHGMIEPWALQQSRFKKRVAMWLYQRRCLESAFCIRATSALEAQSIRKAGFKNKIALIPNGAKIPPALSPRNISPDRIRRVLFLSRIHPKKGLLNLVKAWHEVKPNGWQLLIIGPDEVNHLAEVQAAVRARNLQGQIIFQGETLGAEKTKLYCESDLFVLPSFSENFGLVIAEALVCGTPVITTRATPWEELKKHQCGWWIETGVEPLVRALREAIALSDAERNAMGERGQRLIEEHYTWPAIGRQMIAVYEWMLGNGPKPGCVVES